MKYIKEYEEQELKDLIGDLKSVGQTEEWQVIFDDSDGDGVPYTLETWSTKAKAEKWADSHEFEYEDEVWNSAKKDYEYRTFYKYHNPEDGQIYHSYQVKKI